ncbi:hypothetical protein [Streptomyces chryseus]|uniref:hypothetical protein n=1 Tax=Streptomyces chryseus TaxID=68186 RepID=UPI001677C88C|nr:hypothetical protein [Streptomyces chryseus]GGW96765.1 hypothetical protein GCM10010353_10070 [Streptomyces chryseus]
MPAMCLVPRAVRSGALTVLLVLTAVLAVVLGEGGSVGQVRPPVMWAAGEAAALGGGAGSFPSPGSGAGSGAGGEGQPSDAGDSEVRGAGDGARGARRERVRSGSRGRAVGVVTAYRRTRNGGRRPGAGRAVPGADVAPAAGGERRRVVLRC